MLNLMSFSPSNFGRYVSQTEQSINETNGTDEWSQSQSTPPLQSSTINDIPTFMPISTTPSPSIIPTTTNNKQKITIPSSMIKDDVELLPFPQHGPGPIQRPNKLTCPSTQQSTVLSSSSYLANALQSPGTPDVLDQINRLLDHQNSTTSNVSSASNVNNSSLPINDLTTPNIPWTPFAPTEWSTKYDSSWPLTNIQSPSVPLTTQIRNPFIPMSTMNGQQQQQQHQRPTTGEEATVWSSALGTVTPRLVSSSVRTQRASQWNEIFQSTVPSSNEATKTTNNSWFWTAPDPSPADVTNVNGHETETNAPFWSLGTLSNESVVPSTISNPQGTPSTVWWSNVSSDENNNTSQTNHLNDDPTNNRDQSRWEFAR